MAKSEVIVTNVLLGIVVVVLVVIVVLCVTRKNEGYFNKPLLKWNGPRDCKKGRACIFSCGSCAELGKCCPKANIRERDVCNYINSQYCHLPTESK